MQLPRLAIISPCYNEELLIRDTGRVLAGVLDDLIAKNKVRSDSFIFFVDDGSADSSWRLIEDLHARDQRIKGIKFSRNFGYQSAHLAGLMQARSRADYFVSIDSDLQDDPVVIERFIDAQQEGYDIVFGIKNNSRRDSLYKKYGNKLFYLLMRLLGAPILNNHAEFRFASRKVVDALAEYGEVNLFLRGIFRDLGFKAKLISYQIRERKAGESKFTLKKLLALALDGVTSFSVIPLRLIVFCGVAMLMAALVVLIWATWLPALILCVAGIQTIALGVVAEYVGKTYIEAKGRPRYIVEKEI